MTSQQQALSAYRNVAAQVHPKVAVVKLYDVAILAVRDAIKAAATGRVEDGYIAVNKACKVLRGLSSNLRGDGEMTKLLQSTYVVNMIALHGAFGKPDAERRYRRIIDGLIELRNAWAVLAGMPQSR